MKITGTRYMAANRIEKCILGVNLKDRKENLAGLQLADLVVTPIGRHVLAKETKEDFKIIESKMRRNANGKIEEEWFCIYLVKKIFPL